MTKSKDRQAVEELRQDADSVWAKLGSQLPYLRDIMDRIDAGHLLPAELLRADHAALLKVAVLEVLARNAERAVADQELAARSN